MSQTPPQLRLAELWQPSPTARSASRSPHGSGPQVIRALGDVFERWDGGGVPGKASGEQLAVPARIATFALDAEWMPQHSDMP